MSSKAVDVQEALRAVRMGRMHSARSDGVGSRPAVLIVGGGGPLGSAVVEQALSSNAFGMVRVLVQQDLKTGTPGLAPLRWTTSTDPEVGAAAAGADGAAAGLSPGTVWPSVAILVFDRPRHANGRDAAFFQPQPTELLTLTQALKAQGVRDLVVLMPHSANGLPEALKQGLANLDEHALAAQGFEHLVLLRTAQAPSSADRTGAWPQRLAHWFLRQLQMMVPQVEQPVRPPKLAAFALAIAQQLPGVSSGTRIAPPALVWQSAQVANVHELAAHWLSGRSLSEWTVKPPRY